jgi:hypothetical protein
VESNPIQSEFDLWGELKKQSEFCVLRICDRCLEVKYYKRSHIDLIRSAEDLQYGRANG